MKVVLSKLVVSTAIKKGAIAAFTEEGQNEDIKVKNATKSCMFIEAAADSITFKSTVSLMAASYCIQTGEGVVIEEEGSVCISVSELKKLMDKVPNDKNIRLTYTPVDNVDGIDHTKTVQRCGTILVEVFDEDSVSVTGEFEAFPSSEFNQPDMDPEGSKEILSAKVSTILSAYARTEFAINSDHLGEFLSKIGIFPTDKNLYFVGTDGRRCAIVDLNAEEFEAQQTDVKILIDAVMLKPALSVFDEDETLRILEHPDGLNFILAGNNSRVKMYGADNENKEKFPDFKKVMNFSTPVKFVLDKADLVLALESISVVNKDRSKYIIAKGKKDIQIEGRSLGTGLKKVKASVKCEEIQQSLAADGVCLSTSYFLDSVKRLKGEQVTLSFTEDEKRVRVEATENPSFTYLMQRMYDRESS
jgi:DNA polymerase III sliding clamp (beta) subunit (PCNA family)